MKSQAYQFIYNEINVGFMLNPNNNNLMVNATQMAKIFDKRIDVFMKTDHAQEFIRTLQLPPNGGRSFSLKEDEIIKTINGKATWMHRLLALKFAAWLDVEFEIWIYNTIDSILFGHYKKHWEAHAKQEEAKIKMDELKKQILTAPTPELVAQYFDCEKEQQNALSQKKKALKHQLNLFNYLQNL